MKKLLAMGLACCLPMGFAADEPEDAGASLGTVNALVIEDSVPIAKDALCARNPAEQGQECMAFHRAVLTARVQKVSTLRDRGRWM